MTKLGLYLAKRSINKADLARRIGVTKQRFNQLTNNEKSVLKASELFLIAKAINVSLPELSEELFDGLRLID